MCLPACCYYTLLHLLSTIFSFVCYFDDAMQCRVTATTATAYSCVVSRSGIECGVFFYHSWYIYSNTNSGLLEHDFECEKNCDDVKDCACVSVFVSYIYTVDWCCCRFWIVFFNIPITPKWHIEKCHLIFTPNLFVLCSFCLSISLFIHIHIERRIIMYLVSMSFVCWLIYTFW